MPEKTGKSSLVLKLAVVLAVVVAAGWLALNSFRATATVAAVTRGDAVDVVTGSLVVHADGELRELKSEADGRVVWCDALAVGGNFKKGDELMRLDADDLKREIELVKTTYTDKTERKKIELKNDPRMQDGQKAFDEAKRQHDRHDTSDLEFESAQRTFEKLKTALELETFDAGTAKTDYEATMAEKNRALERMTVRAPIDGVVESSNVYVGALVSKGATVATYYSTARNVVAKISEDSAGKLAVGQKAKVRLLNYGSDEFFAKVVKILPFADVGTQQSTAFLEVGATELPPEKLKPGSTGEVTITVGERPNALLIPRRALFSGIDGHYVFVVKGGRVEKRKVETGFIGLNLAEVRKSLDEGELVIVSDREQFRDGQRVRTTQEN